MSKIINFGITEDDINWREKDNYMVEDDKIDYKQYGNIMSGKEYGWGLHLEEDMMMVIVPI